MENVKLENMLNSPKPVMIEVSRSVGNETVVASAWNLTSLS